MMVNKFYVATAIPYVNGSPHIGHVCDAIESDVIARYHRLLGDETFYLAGVDKNGQKNYQSAQKEGLDTKVFVDRNSKEFLDLYKRLGSSFDQFIETTDNKLHNPGVIKFWNKLVESGDIYKDKYDGMYCVGHEAFLTESDLVNGKCPDHPNKPLERLSEENYLFRFSKYVPKVMEKIESGELNIIPGFRKTEMLNLLRNNEGDVSFSRPFERVPWGIKVPGDETQVIYVWADALVNYLTGIGYGRDEREFTKWWPTDVNVLGKDILRFHAGLWPAMLMSAELSLPKTVFVHGFVNLGGAKLSKTTGNIVNPLGMINKFGADALRYFLLSEGPPTQDIDFTNDRFEEKYNSDLANGLGNLVSRVANLAEMSSLKLPTKSNKPLLDSQYRRAMEEFRFNDALTYIWNKITATDKLLTQHKPWEHLEDGSEEAKEIIKIAALQIREVGELILPFLPATANKVITIFEGPEVFRAEPLFPRIEKG
jgi:methionyl-tRNA synthetase